MRITLFGASSETGKLVIEQALAAGHQLVAFVRNPKKIGAGNDLLSVIMGELDDGDAIEAAVAGTDAVISVLGPRPDENLHGKPLTQGMQNILYAMQKMGVRRLIVCSTPSASDPNDLPDPKFKVLVALAKSTMRPAYDEIVNVARIVRASDTDWTIVRVALLNNTPGTGRIRSGYLGRNQVGTHLSRTDLAAFLLRQVEDTNLLQQAPAVSN